MSQQQRRAPSNALLASFASLSLSAANRNPRKAPQPVFDLAMPKDEVKARLSPIPVYTVANKKNEFVLVTGENNRQIGFFFLNKEDAEALIAKIRQENPKIAKDTGVMRTTLDAVYEVFTMPREESGLQGIHFRFMPDMREVENALQLFTDANVPTSAFVGVPVFQADGLTVTTERSSYVPLFLSKGDMDIAVDAAYKARNAAQIQQYQDTAAKYREEYERVKAEAAAAKESRERLGLEQKAEKAQQKYSVALKKAEDVARAPLPKVEVGSLEEVIMRMTAAEGDDYAAWSQVMFVTPGVLAAKGAGASDGKQGK